MKQVIQSFPNRKDRRKHKIEFRPPVLNIREDDLETMLSAAKLEASKQAIKLITAAIVKGLHNEYDFGTLRINKVLDRAKVQLECIRMKTLTTEELYKWCYDNKINLD